MKHNLELPLIEEVNELIEKEKKLLELKLIDEKNQAIEWKIKHDQLLEHINDSKLKGKEKMEVVNQTISDHAFNTLEEVIKWISSHKNSWCFNICEMLIKESVLVNAIKLIYGPRSTYNLPIAIMKNCSLGDDVIPSLIHMIRNPILSGLDLSKNHLSDVFFHQLCEVLSNRRNTPQYLLLDGNIHLSHNCHLSSIFDLLSEHTWGLTVSLPDFVALPTHLPDSKVKKLKSPSEIPNIEYKELSKQPMKLFEFLRALNHKLESLPHLIESMQSSSNAVLPPKVVKKKGRIMNGMQAFSVLGLKYFQFSRHSIAQLELMIHLSIASLTDLDLSFGLIGFHGAQMLSKVLHSADCQIIRLGLLGNAVGDDGTSLLLKGMTENKTLTYVDLRSNNLSNVGLYSLGPILKNNATLSTIDLRGNYVTWNKGFQIKQYLKNLGSVLKIIISDHDCSSLSTSAMLVHDESDRLDGSKDHCAYVDPPTYEHPHRISVTLKSNPKVDHSRHGCIHQVDLNTLNLRHSNLFGHPIELSWKWRPFHPKKESLRSSSQVMHQFEVEIRIKLGSQVLHRISKSLSPSSAAILHHPFGSSSSNNIIGMITESPSQYDWINHSCLLYELPVNGRIEIWIQSIQITRDSSTSSIQPSNKKTTIEDQIHQNSKFLNSLSERTKKVDKKPMTSDDQVQVEVKDVKLRSMPLQDSYILCGDLPLHQTMKVTPSLNKVINDHSMHPSLKQKVHHLEPDCVVLRSFVCCMDFSNRLEDVMNWPENRKQLILTWTASLAYIQDNRGVDWDADSNVQLIENNNPTLRDSIGFRWNVYVYSVNESLHKIASGECISNQHASDDIDPSSNRATESTRSSWEWNSFSIGLGNIRTGDVLVLTANVFSSQFGCPSSYLNQCSVIVKNCGIICYSPDVCVEKQSLETLNQFYQSDVVDTISSVIFNDDTVSAY